MRQSKKLLKTEMTLALASRSFGSCGGTRTNIESINVVEER